MNHPSPEHPTPTRLSTPDFHARVLSLNPRIAVFDCDGTLWSGDAGSAFMHWTINTKLISPEQIAWINARYDGYQRGTVSEYDICGEMVQLYRGLPIETLRAAAADFFTNYIEPNIFPELATLIAELQHNNCDIWAVSSTNNWVIEEGVRRFNIPANRVLAARVEIDNGIITDRLIHVPTDEDKVEALRRVDITAGTTANSNPPDAVFGNSIHDAAMLSIARTQHNLPSTQHNLSRTQHNLTAAQTSIAGAFPVNPSTALLTRSFTEGWPIYYPASVTP